jgi:hypothetical protein
MADTLLLLQPWLNKTYTDIVNSEISVPPYYPWKVQHTFFLRKRKWIHQFKDFGWDEILDFILFEDNYYALVKDWTNVYLKKNTAWSILWTWTYNTTTKFQFNTFQSAKWTILDSWINADWIVASSDTLLEDTTKAWTVNEYAGNYVYITWTWVWAWRVSQIGWNTATWLKIDWWYNTPDSVNYSIFEDYGEVLAFTWWNWLYTINNETSPWIIRASKLWNIIDFTIVNHRLIYLLEDWYLWESLGWYFMFQTEDLKYIGRVAWALAIFQYNDFIICWSKESITIIKSQSTKVTEFYVETWEVLSKQVSLDNYTISQTINTMWLFSKDSYVIYNTWVYLFTANRKFIALWITWVTDTQYSIKQDDQWWLIQKYLDNISDDASVSMSITEESIRILSNNWEESFIYIFNLLYTTWHTWETDLYLTSIKKYIDQYYFWDKIYIYDDDTLDDDIRYKDAWIYEYNQEITAIIWEAEIMSMKRYLLAKFLIWVNTDPETIIKFTSRFWWKEYNIRATFEDLQYLKKAALTDSSWTLWVPITWTWVFWWPLWDLITWDSDISLVEIPLWQAANMFKVKIIWDIEFWWMMVAYDVLQTHLTELQWVS